MHPVSVIFRALGFILARERAKKLSGREKYYNKVYFINTLFLRPPIRKRYESGPLGSSFRSTSRTKTAGIHNLHGVGLIGIILFYEERLNEVS